MYVGCGDHSVAVGRGLVAGYGGVGPFAERGDVGGDYGEFVAVGVGEREGGCVGDGEGARVGGLGGEAGGNVSGGDERGGVDEWKDEWGRLTDSRVFC